MSGALQLERRSDALLPRVWRASSAMRWNPRVPHSSSLCRLGQGRIVYDMPFAQQPMPTLCAAETDFGQTDFGQFYCFSIFLFFKKKDRATKKHGRTSTLSEGCRPKGGAPKGGPEPRKGGAPKGGAPKGRAPKGGAPKGGGPKISRFFFPFPATISLFLCLSGCLLVEFWWCLKRRSPSMCACGVLGLS